ncbi:MULTISPECIES: MotA/TolQ/ExbB proton channel family protein [unclassified Emticicia]|uniref:MotA/TolQ/ExbB proton channel family protein n=1 Tax=unclassified Emticicia TaxID=2627301 RepID=UPI000C7863FE|nr:MULTISPECIES: MotA/TolQ/ExbB proton channel family protein [unclassified Emticicia]PLK44625.1 flagellar motor protein MotA [Emticicia sp. TH156]UTA66288.1 MotA/TolQ/ExbB proton channel family protein [Emticicia sp. 21SJ11W-3]
MEKKTTAPAAKPAAPKSSSGGLNPAFVIPILLVIGFCLWYFILGDSANFSDPETKHKPITAMGIVYSGGIIVPILLTFMLSVLVFSIERFITINKASGTGDLDAFVRKVRSLVDSNNIAEAIKECDKQKGSVGNVTKTALQKYNQLAADTSLLKDQKLVALQKEVEEATTLELPMLEKNLTILSTLASVSTLVALLGTVIGMIRSFFALGSGGGAPDASALATGIAEALINTALGIGTSAISIIMYNLFTSKIDTLTYKIDEIGMSLQQNFAAHH